MKSAHYPRRAGFTLIEILVVIAIIAILAAITIPAVMWALGTGTETKVASEIGQLSTGLTNFKSKFGCFPPSYIKLYPNRSDYLLAATDPLEKESLYWLDKIWPRLGKFTSVNWNGGLTATWPVVLEGDQCLVFFLNGIPGAQGFSTSPTDPSRPPTAANPERIGPFYLFEPARLVAMPIPAGYTNPRSPVFPSYLDGRSSSGDPKSKPYAYFNSGKKSNQYDTAVGTGIQCGLIGALPYYFLVTVPNPTPPPATTTLKKFHNPDTYQLIYAGKDRTFGGNLWDPANPNNLAPPTGMDDRTNFCVNILSAGN